MDTPTPITPHPNITCTTRYKHIRGLTLINLLVTLLLVGLLLTTGITGLSTLSAQIKANNTNHYLFNLIQFSRLQAASYRASVILCPTLDQYHCSGNWNHALMVFVDRNDDKERGKGEELLHMREALLEDHEHIVWQASGNNHYLRFFADGATRNQNGRLSYCLKKHDKIYSRQIIIYLTGRARKAHQDDAQHSCQY